MPTAHSRSFSDPRKVRSQAVEAEVNDRDGWFAVGPLPVVKGSKRALQLSG